MLIVFFVKHVSKSQNNMMINKLKTELKQGKNFISFTFLKLLGEGMYYILPLIIAKYLSPAEFGSFSLAYMIVLLFTTIFITSSQTPFIVLTNMEINKGKKINKSFSVVFSFFIFSIMFVSIIFFLFRDTFANFAGLDIFQVNFILLAYFGIAIKLLFETLFLAFDEKMKNAAYSFCIGITNLFLIFIFSILFTLKIELIFLSYFLSSLVVTSISLFFIDLKKLVPFELNSELFLELFRWTKWQIMGLTAVYFINWGDNLVLRYFVSMEEIGVYNLGYQIFKGLIGATLILNVYFLPFVSQNINDKEKMKKYIYIIRYKIMLIGVAGIISIFITVPFIFNIIYGDVYSGSITVLRILLIGVCFHLYMVFYIPLFNSLKRYEFIQTANIIQILINICLNIILVPKIGIVGAAIGTTTAYFIVLILYEWHYSNNFSNRLTE